MTIPKFIYLDFFVFFVFFLSLIAWALFEASRKEKKKKKEKKKNLLSIGFFVCVFFRGLFLFEIVFFLSCSLKTHFNLERYRSLESCQLESRMVRAYIYIRAWVCDRMVYRKKEKIGQDSVRG